MANPSIAPDPQLRSYHEMLDLRRRQVRNFAGLWLALAILSYDAGSRICDFVAHARAAAGSPFDHIDQASDYLFLGILLAVIFLVMALFASGQWLWLGSLQKRHQQPIPGINVSSPPEEA